MLPRLLMRNKPTLPPVPVCPGNRPHYAVNSLSAILPSNWLTIADCSFNVSIKTTGKHSTNFTNTSGSGLFRDALPNLITSPYSVNKLHSPLICVVRNLTSRCRILWSANTACCDSVLTVTALTLGCCMAHQMTLVHLRVRTVLEKKLFLLLKNVVKCVLKKC